MNKRICEDCMYCYVDKNNHRKCKVKEASGDKFIISSIKVCPLNVTEKDIDFMDSLNDFSADNILFPNKIKC